MKFTKLLMGIILGASLYAIPSAANAAGCSLQGITLKCNTEAKTAEAIMKAFASEETREMLGDPLSQKETFKKNGDLEKYRKSMERNWRVITRYAKQQERRKNRRRLSEIQFQAWAKEFAEAEKSYAVALNFYRQLHWQGLK